MIRALNILCFTICIVCICASVVIGLMMVWTDRGDREQQIRLLVSCGIVFLGAVATMSVSRVFGKRVQS
jgi:Na+/melibiose symporter-like transporter